MNPKKARDFYKVVAEEQNLSEEVVQDIVELYWKTVRKTLSNLEHAQVRIHNLGLFYIKRDAVDEGIEEYTTKLQNAKTDTFSNMQIKKSYEEYLTGLLNIKEKVKINNDKRLNKKAERRAFILAKANMEKQVANTARSMESNPQETSCGDRVFKENEDLQCLPPSGCERD